MDDSLENIKNTILQYHKEKQELNTTILSAIEDIFDEEYCVAFKSIDTTHEYPPLCIIKLKLYSVNYATFNEFINYLGVPYEDIDIIFSNSSDGGTYTIISIRFLLK